MSSAFGAGQELDAYLLAVVTPTVIATIVGDVVYTLLLPEVMADTRRANRWGVVSWATLGLLALTIAYSLCWLAGVLVFQPGTRGELLLRLGLLTAPLIFLLSFGSLGATVLIAARRYALASVRIPLTSLVTVLTFVLWTRIASGVTGLAVSVDVGALVSALVMFVCLVLLLGAPAAGMSRADALAFLKRVRGTSAALLTSAVVAQAATPIERIIAFAIGPGIVSALNYGRVLVSPPLLVGQSIATAAFPGFVARRAASHPDRYAVLGRSISMTVFLLLPMSVLVAGLAPWLVELVYHRGAFDQEAVRRTTVTGAILAAALVPIAVGAVVTRFLYAEQKAQLVARASIAGLVAYVVLALALGVGFGYAGMALASTLSYVLLMCLLIAIAAGGSTAGAGFLLWRDLARSATASALAGAAVWAVNVGGGSRQGNLAALVMILIGGSVGAAAFVVAALALRAPELTQGLAVARRALPFHAADQP